MQGGKLDQEIQLQSLSEVNDGGELKPTYTTVRTVACDVLTPRGSESFEAARINARETVRIKMRYVDGDDITTEWRFIWENQAYNIQAVDRSERRKGELWLTGTVIGAK